MLYRAGGYSGNLDLKFKRTFFRSGHRYPDWSFHDFLQSLQENYWTVHRLYHDTFPQNPFQVFNHRITPMYSSHWQPRHTNHKIFPCYSLMSVYIGETRVGLWGYIPLQGHWSRPEITSNNLLKCCSAGCGIIITISCGITPHIHIFITQFKKPFSPPTRHTVAVNKHWESPSRRLNPATRIQSFNRSKMWQQ
jgi:hypothetical protein